MKKVSRDHKVELAILVIEVLMVRLAQMDEKVLVDKMVHKAKKVLLDVMEQLVIAVREERLVHKEKKDSTESKEK